MPLMLQLLPDAKVIVAASERSDYLAVVPRRQLLTHDELPTLSDIRNHINGTMQEQCVVMVDDDLNGVMPLIARKKKVLRDPELIFQIVENSHRICEDLDLGLFCYTRSPNTVMMEPECKPFRLVGPAMSAFGVRGPARERHFDPEMANCEDFDFSLQAALADRIMLCDMRFYFDFGRIFTGVGGNAGKMTAERIETALAALKRKWGEFVDLAPSKMKKNQSTLPVTIRVKRQAMTDSDL